MPNVQTVNLSKLRHGGDLNVHAGVSAADKALVASIKEFGLLNPLTVVPDAAEAGAFKVIAGGRRLAALKVVHGKKDPPIPVMVADKATEARAREISLAENVARIQLHPVDEYEAYRRMIENDGATVAQVAARYHVKPKWVSQRLQLAGLSPALRTAWREGKMSAEQAEALSTVPDHDRQLKVWIHATRKGAGGDWDQRPQNLRAAVLDRGMKTDDPCFAFVGTTAYIAAGGRITEDLFHDEQRAIDMEIVERLIEEKLTAECAKYLADGWAWALPHSRVEVDLGIVGWKIDYLDLDPWFTDEDRKVMAGKNWNAKQKVIAEVAKRAAADPICRAQSGVVVDLRCDGTIDAERFRVVPEKDKPQEGDDGDPADNDDENEYTADRKARPAPNEDEPKVNFALRESLSEQLTVALSKALANDPGVALSALLASLQVTMTTYEASPLRLNTHEAWEGVAPAREHDSSVGWPHLFVTINKLSLEGKLELLAKMVSETLDLRQKKFDDRRDWSDVRYEAAATLAAALLPADVNREVAAAFNAADYFDRSNAEACKAALAEMGGTGPKKKKELAAFCVVRAEHTGWLPPELRLPNYLGPKA